MKAYLDFGRHDCSINRIMKLQAKYKFSLPDGETVPYVSIRCDSQTRWTKVYESEILLL